MRQATNKKITKSSESSGQRMIKKERPKGHILLVANDSLLRTAIAFLCEDSGFIVSQANSSGNALLMVDESRDEYDLVIIDTGMPGNACKKVSIEMAKSYKEKCSYRRNF